MKKLIILLTMFFMLIGSMLNGCIIHFEPKKINLPLNKVTTLTVYVELEHRKCDIPLEDTNYSAKGVIILKKGEWIKVKRNLYKQEITVKVFKSDAVLKIWRDCEEKGISEGCLNCSGCTKKK